MKIKALKRLICGLLGYGVCFSLLSFNCEASIKQDTLINKGFKLKTIVVDAGHGGEHEGTGSRFSHGASGSYSSERNVTLAIALKLQKAIEKDVEGVRVVMTRTTDEDVDWQKRADIANQNKGDLFISLHCNSLSNKTIREQVGTKHHKPVYKTISVPNRSGKGVLILVYGSHRTKEEETAIKNTQIEEDTEMDSTPDPNDPTAAILINEYKRKFRARSIKLANLINDEFVTVDGRPSEGVREQGVLVLCHSAMPAVLIETGYINNPDDEAYLNSENGQNEIVATIIRALTKYKNEVEQVVQQ